MQDDGASVLLNAILGMAVADGKATQAAPAPPVVWCRDAQEVKLGGVYRANEQRDGYLVAFADSGRAAIVEPNAGAHMLAQIDPAKKEAASWTVSLVLMQRTLTSGGFDRLPAPAQAQQVVEAGRFASSQPTWGDGKRAINVSRDAMK